VGTEFLKIEIIFTMNHSPLKLTHTLETAPRIDVSETGFVSVMKKKLKPTQFDNLGGYYVWAPCCNS
jgi:hypothetical protein